MIRSVWLIFSGNGIVSSLNKTANENNLDLAILKNAVGYTILDVESLDEEMGKLKACQSKFLNQFGAKIEHFDTIARYSISFNNLIPLYHYIA